MGCRRRRKRRTRYWIIHDRPFPTQQPPSPKNLQKQTLLLLCLPWGKKVLVFWAELRGGTRENGHLLLAEEFQKKREWKKTYLLFSCKRQLFWSEDVLPSHMMFLRRRRLRERRGREKVNLRCGKMGLSRTRHKR